MDRRSAFAGSWYPGTREKLRTTLEELIPSSPEPVPALATLAPHAGYIYSGGVAGAVYGAVRIPERVILLSTNHRGFGEDFAVWPAGTWGTPLGDVAVDSNLTTAVLKMAPGAVEDTTAHLEEHSGEMQVPFLRHRRPDVRMAVVAVGSHRRPDLVAFGDGVADLVRSETKAGREILIAATTDLNHYEDQETTLRKDRAAIEPILALDVEGLFAAVAKHRISMCGLGPTAVMMAAARALGATGAELIEHKTSGDVSGDFDRVVGYPAIAVYPRDSRTAGPGVRH